MGITIPTSTDKECWMLSSPSPFVDPLILLVACSVQKELT